MTDTIKKGDKVKVSYTGKLEDGNVFDTSENKAPLSFEVGAGQVIPGFDKAVEGMKKDEDKTFTLSVEDAYGPVKKELVQEFPKDKLPKEPEPKEPEPKCEVPPICVWLLLASVNIAVVAPTWLSEILNLKGVSWLLGEA